MKATLAGEDITNAPEKIPGEAWCYPPHHDEDWRLCDGAYNAWMGTLEDKDGNELLDLAEWAAEDFNAAFRFVQQTVQNYNKIRFDLVLIDYE